LHFTPSQSAGERLQAQGVPAERIVVSGNTAMGTLRTAADHIQRDAVLARHLGQCFAFLREGSPLLLMADRESMQFGNSDGKPSYQEFPILHRRRASDMPINDAFEPICRALMSVAARRPDVDIVYPIDDRLISMATMKEQMRGYPNVHLIAPTDYLSFAYLLNTASAILADSSDLAFEVAAFGKPVLLVQEQAGVSPAIDSGNVSRVGVGEHAIATRLMALLADCPGGDQPVDLGNSHRDASQRIAEALASLRQPPPAPANRLMPPVQIRPVAEGLREVS
jgi:UDP-N-acetylglucosamine 2-epimerase (hydrolysing)